jgi:putative phosphoribosyl transferase
MNRIFENRKQAGRLLSTHLNLSKAEKSNAVILALPRCGVPVAFEISKLLKIPLEVMIVRKIGHPLQPEYE